MTTAQPSIDGNASQIGRQVEFGLTIFPPGRRLSVLRSSASGRWTCLAGTLKLCRKPGRMAMQKTYTFNQVLTITDPMKPFSSGLPESVEELARRASASATLTERVRLALPEPVRSHVIAAARRGEDLVVIVDSAAWSARVRYAGRGLKAALADAGEREFDRLRVRVGAPPTP